MRRLVLLILAITALAPAAAHALPQISVKCNNSSDCEDVWFTSSVFVDWTVEGATSTDGCDDVTLNQDTKGSPQGCIASGNGTVGVTVIITIDKTPPSILGATPSRSADANGWYNHAVGITFTGQDVTSGLASCTATTYGGPDTGAGAVPGTCRDVAGNVSAPLNFAIRYDATAPDITDLVPERPPDNAGWYTSPVAFGVQSTDATSGIAGCAPVNYAGPDGAGAAIVAACTDRAGNPASRAFSLHYDATPPDAPAAEIGTGDRVVRLRWPAAAAITVVRTPGVAGAPSSVVHSGPGSGMTDRRVRNGRRYHYSLTLTDEAGNSATRELNAVPGPHLLEPADGARVAAPPRLHWTRVRGARYYNVQLFRDGRKILSAWPRKASLQLRRRWHFAGRRYRLTADRYRWYVWPGEGPRAARDYGPQIGAQRFVLDPAGV